jgi:hypothetical protein
MLRVLHGDGEQLSWKKERACKNQTTEARFGARTLEMGPHCV